MIKELIQKRGYNYRKHTLFNDKVVVEYRNLQQVIKYEVKIDEIGFDLQYERENDGTSKALFILFFISPFFVLSYRYFVHNLFDYKTSFIMFGMCFFLCSLIFLKQHKDDIFLIGFKNLVFYRKIPNEEGVLNFINSIISTSKNYLKNKYTIIEEDLTEEEFSGRLKWLFDKLIITQEELNELKQHYKIKKLLE